MKNIFKKNHIIITALAIMIVIAGYLSFTNDDTPTDGNTVEMEDKNSEGYQEFTEVEGIDVATTTDTDTTDTDTTDTDDTDTTDTDDTLDDTEADTTADENDEDETLEMNEESDELGDISDEDILASAQDVSDSGEIDLEEGVPGEAVLANAAIDASYFISNRIKREQARAKNKATFMDIIESSDISDELKKDAINGMLELTDTVDKENAAEMLLEAKGFDDAVVFINDGEVEVVVNAVALSDQQLAIIEDIVKDKTGITVEHIGINPVVISE